MRILYFGNNWLGLHVLKWLKEQKEEIAGLVIHQTGKYKSNLIDVSGLPNSRILSSPSTNSDSLFETIEQIDPDIGISILYGYILNDRLVSMFRNGCINLHLSFLPYNRGAFPNVWPIVEQTPAGVSLHYMNTGIDTGDIIAQNEVPIEPIDTGKKLYSKLEKAGFKLFTETWPLIKLKKNKKLSQNNLKIGTYHKVEDVERIDQIDLNKYYKAKDIVNILRARTFPPYKGAYFIDKGKKVYLNLELFYEDN